jgi:hypothetical protein
MTFKSDADIINEIVKNIEEKDVLHSIPHIILYMERYYKQISGTNKKKLVLGVIGELLNQSNLNEAAKESIVIIAPYIIDSIVFVANNSKDFLKKSKKFCCRK